MIPKKLFKEGGGPHLTSAPAEGQGARYSYRTYCLNFSLIRPRVNYSQRVSIPGFALSEMSIEDRLPASMGIKIIGTARVSERDSIYCLESDDTVVGPFKEIDFQLYRKENWDEVPERDRLSTSGHIGSVFAHPDEDSAFSGFLPVPASIFDEARRAIETGTLSELHLSFRMALASLDMRWSLGNPQDPVEWVFVNRSEAAALVELSIFSCAQKTIPATPVDIESAVGNEPSVNVIKKRFVSPTTVQILFALIGVIAFFSVFGWLR